MMSTILLALLLSSTVTAGVPTADSAPCDLYVAPPTPTAAQDATLDTAAAPFHTLEAARDARRTLSRDRVVTICLASGTYYRTSPLLLNFQDSNTTWRGPAVIGKHAGEGGDKGEVGDEDTPVLDLTATISGGIPIPSSMWQRFNSTLTRRGGVKSSSREVPEAPLRWDVNLSQIPAAAAITLLPDVIGLGQLRHLYDGATRVYRTVAAGTQRGGTEKHTGPVWGKSAFAVQSKGRGTNFSCDAGATTNTTHAHCGDGNPVRVSSSGFTILDPVHAQEALSWPNAGRGVEFVFSGVDPAPWAESRCAVLEVKEAAGGADGADGTMAVVTMQPGCHTR